MKKTILDSAAYIFILAVIVLTLIMVAGIWDFLDRDVIDKSAQTLGVLGFISLMILLVGHFSGKGNKENQQEIIHVPDPLFQSIRKTTVVVFIFLVSILAFFSVLAIWELVSDKDILYKSLSSVGVFTFSSVLIILTSLSREKSEN